MPTTMMLEAYPRIVQSMHNAVLSLPRLLKSPTKSIVIKVTSEHEESSQITIKLKNTAHKIPFVEHISYFLHTLFLFLYSDLKTVVIPWTIFGIAHALAASVFSIDRTSSTAAVLARTPLIILWILLNLLPATIGNQRHASAIKEDAINKPWRPLPSNRLTPSDARNLLVAAYLVAISVSLRINGVQQSIVLAILGYAYNDMGGDNHWAPRNLLNGLAFICFGSGAMEVALGQAVVYPAVLTQWLRMITLVVFTGAHVFDMYDQAGDALIGRKTLPLVIGDNAARWCIAVPVLFWSVFCPWFWQIQPVGYILPVAGGLIVARRTMSKREVQQDKKTTKIWNLWLVAIYCLPLVKFASHVVS